MPEIIPDAREDVNAIYIHLENVCKPVTKFGIPLLAKVTSCRETDPQEFGPPTKATQAYHTPLAQEEWQRELMEVSGSLNAAPTL